MKSAFRWRTLLYLTPLMVFFCQKTNSPWGFCVGNNDGFQMGGEDTEGAPFNFALGGTCPDDFPFPDEPLIILPI